MDKVVREEGYGWWRVDGVGGGGGLCAVRCMCPAECGGLEVEDGGSSGGG